MIVVWLFLFLLLRKVIKLALHSVMLKNSNVDFGLIRDNKKSIWNVTTELMKVLSRIKDARTNILTLLMKLFLFLLQRKLKLPNCPLVLIFSVTIIGKLKARIILSTLLSMKKCWDGRGFESKVEHKGSLYRCVSSLPRII